MIAATSRASGRSCPTRRTAGWWPWRRGALFSFGEDLEQELGPASVELHVTQLVEEQQVDASVTRYESRQSLLVGGLGQLVHQLRAGDVAHGLAISHAFIRVRSAGALAGAESRATRPFGALEVTAEASVAIVAGSTRGGEVEVL